MKNVGIWLDKQKAYIITLESNREVLCTIFSEVEDYHVSGGSGTRFKGGPQDVVQDSKYLEREKHQLKAYFRDIVAKIKGADSIALFGPAETYKEFEKELVERHQELSQKICASRNVDSMTVNQTVALIKDFYNSPHGR